MNAKIALLIIVPLAAGSAIAAERLHVEVKETAGIQRFSYPVEGRFTFPKTSSEPRFRLLDGEKAIRAQFTPLDPRDQAQPDEWAVDFNIDLAPNETRTLGIESDPNLEPVATGARGLTVNREDGFYHVKHPTLEFVVPEDFSRPLSAVRIGDDELLVAGASNAVIYLRDGTQMPFSTREGSGQVTAPRAVKRGPLMATLECLAAHKFDKNGGARSGIRSRVQMAFPLGKSWVRVDWDIDDPQNRVRAVSTEFQLRLEPDAEHPVLADVGADGWTYSVLRAEEKMLYLAGPNGAAWRVSRLLSGREVPYVVKPTAGESLRPEGWAHLMDGKRSVALAVDGFGAQYRDTIDLSAQGHLRLGRDFAETAQPEQGFKRFTYWLHFVKTPPQVGAATSPQSMQLPPEVRVVEASPK